MTTKTIAKSSIIILLSMALFSCPGKERKTITILATTDVHGTIFPYDFIKKRELKVSLAGVSSYLKKIKNENGAVVLLDGGDNLQGQAAVYYYNFIDTVSPHLNAEVMNYLGYDAGTIGNHDLEAGHPVYDKLVGRYDFPLLAANAVDISTGNPYFKPYTVVVKDGIKAAIFGLISPSVSFWLQPDLYSGIEFKNMLETTKFYMPVIQAEKPDLIIGLFHSGWDEPEEAVQQIASPDENSAASIAFNVPGFDIIITGHDHRIVNRKIVNSAGDSVLILDGGSRSGKIAKADVVFYSYKTKGRQIKRIKGDIIDVIDFKPDADFLKKFSEQQKKIKEYFDKTYP